MKIIIILASILLSGNLFADNSYYHFLANDVISRLDVPVSSNNNESLEKELILLKSIYPKIIAIVIFAKNNTPNIHKKHYLSKYYEAKPFAFAKISWRNLNIVNLREQHDHVQVDTPADRDVYYRIAVAK